MIRYRLSTLRQTDHFVIIIVLYGMFFYWMFDHGTNIGYKFFTNLTQLFFSYTT